jgi:hypothetical protein
MGKGWSISKIVMDKSTRRRFLGRRRRRSEENIKMNIKEIDRFQYKKLSCSDSE